MADQNNLWLGTSRRDDGVVVGVKGEVDLVGAPKLRDLLDGLLAKGERSVVIDLTGTTLLDSTALGVLVHAQRRFRAAGGVITLRGPCDHVRRILEVTGLDRVFALEA